MREYSPTSNAEMDYQMAKKASLGGINKAALDKPQFEVIADRLANLPSVAHTALQRLRSLADRYGGSQPEAVEAGQAAPPATSLSGRLEQSAYELDNILGAIHSQINRLERF